MKLKKKWGQNILINKQVITQICSIIPNSNCIIEIGPGLGALTKDLLNKSNIFKAIEIDQQACKALQSMFNNTKIQIINQDVLSVDFNILIEKDTVIVGNLPYYISSKIIEKLFYINSSNIKGAYFTVQKELAQRIIANPGPNNSRITVNTKYFFDSFLHFNISPKSFLPEPKVNSCFISLIPNKKQDINMFEKFRYITKSIFEHKRKKISYAFKCLKNTDIGNKRAQDLNIYDIISIIQCI